jgi:antitoxin (DNA-binding transcriptional repressor) of toxin-antitoxin stability system
MDQVAATGDAVVITKRGVPVAELGPARGKAGSLLGSLRGRVEILGDIIAPVEGVTWEATR